jgi:hypothetical protein
MNEDKPKPTILRQDIITDQSDPRMIEFRKSRGEFEPGCTQKTIKLEITEYEPDPDKFKITTQVGYYEGEPPPEYKEFFRRLFRAASEEVTKGKKQ